MFYKSFQQRYRHAISTRETILQKNLLWSPPTTIAILHILLFYYCYLKVVCEYIQSTHWHCPWLLTWLDIKKKVMLTTMRARTFFQSVACRLRHGSGSMLDEVPLMMIDVAIMACKVWHESAWALMFYFDTCQLCATTNWSWDRGVCITGIVGGLI